MANFAGTSVRLNPLTIIVGEEDLIAIESLDQIRAEARKQGFTERVGFNFDGTSDYSPLLQSMGDMSLFGEKKLIEIRLTTGNPGLKKGPEALAALAEAVGDGLIAVISLPGALYEYQKKAWFKKISSSAAIINAGLVSRQQLPGWIRKRASINGQNLSEEAAQFLAASTEGNLLACAQEINKLALLCPRGNIELKDLLEAVSDVSRFNPQDLADSILEGNVQRISKIIDGLKGENISIPSFLWLLNDDIRNLILLNQGGSPSSIRGLPSRKTMLANLARRVPLALLEKVVHRYNNVEKMSKGFKVSQSQGDPWQELKAAALLLCISRR